MTLKVKQLQELHGLRAVRYHNVALALAPRAFVLKMLQKLHTLQGCRLQNVVLALAPRTFGSKICKGFMD